METRVINGETRRVWKLGELSYASPMSIGAGYRERINRAKVNAAISGGTLAATVAELKTKQQPHGIPDKIWERKLRDEAMEGIAKHVDIVGYDEKLVTLQTILTPLDDAPSVETAYMELATPEQVEAIINFTEGIVSDKTETESLIVTNGKATKERKAAHSRNTSPRPSVV